MVSKKMLSIAVVMLLLANLSAIMPVQATEVQIDIDMDDENCTILYNGRDVLAELESYYSELARMKAKIAYLKARADVDDVREGLEELEQAVRSLIEELEMVLNDLYGKVMFLAHITGINPGNESSIIVQSLMSGNASIVDYLEEADVRLDGIDSEIPRVYGELISFEGYTQQQFNETFNELIGFENYTQEQLFNLDSSVSYWANRQIIIEGKLDATQNTLYVFMGFTGLLAVALVYVVKKRS